MRKEESGKEVEMERVAGEKEGGESGWEESGEVRGTESVFYVLPSIK